MKTTTKERPILFSGPMVRAILAGKKRQTRRVIKPQPPACDETCARTRFYDMGDGAGWACASCGAGVRPVHRNGQCVDAMGIKCPYGQPGDVLWVKETWGFHSGGVIVTSEEARPNAWNKAGFGGEGCWSPVVYKAGTEDFAWGMYGPPKWRSPLLMPRSASRLRLPLKSVRVERVQDISDADIVAEGVPDVVDKDGEPFAINARPGFIALWDSINGKTYPWASNPWVWVLEWPEVQA